MPPTILPRHYDAITRDSFYVFVRRAFQHIEPGTRFYNNWHIEVICRQLQDTYEGKVRRLIVNIYPRSLKSIIASVCFPAWVLGKDPKAGFICISYADELSRDLSHKTRELMKTPFYRQVFPGTQLEDHPQRDVRFSTSRKGFRYAATMGGSITGMGADYIIIDDPIKFSDARSETVLLDTSNRFAGIITRLNQAKTGVIALVMQRLHDDDLTGYLLRLGDWQHLRIPAIAEEREVYQRYDEPYVRLPGELLHEEVMGREELDERRRVLGSAGFQAQYQQEPVPPGGDLLRWEWFKSYSGEPDVDYVVQSWDIAYTDSDEADYSVCLTWGVCGEDYFLLHVDRFQSDYTVVLRRAIGLEQTQAPDAIFVEENGIGRVFANTMRERFGERVMRTKQSREKSERAAAITPKLEEGRVHVPESAPWLGDFRREIISFPRGRHDDQVDAMVQFLQHASWLVRRIRSLGLSQAWRRNPEAMCAEKTQGRVRRSIDRQSVLRGRVYLTIEGIGPIRRRSLNSRRPLPGPGLHAIKGDDDAYRAGKVRDTVLS